MGKILLFFLVEIKRIPHPFREKGLQGSHSKKCSFLFDIPYKRFYIICRYGVIFP
jgi:hypothetical protein